MCLCLHREYARVCVCVGVYVRCMRSCVFVLFPMFVPASVFVLRSCVRACICVCMYSCVCVCVLLLCFCECVCVCIVRSCVRVCVCVSMCIKGIACVWLRFVCVCIVRSSRIDGSLRTDRMKRIRYQDSLRDVICVRPPPSPSGLQ